MVETLGHYKVLERIGAGGMGEVYRARDTRLGRTVAIKVLKTDVAADADRRDRFVREAQAAAALSHPNIAALYEIGEDQGQLFLVFEFVPGEPLKTVMGGRPLNPRRAIDLATQIADALADAHAVGIVHRDIKPDNIIVTPKGNAKILDFGLAKWTTGGAERDHAARPAQPGTVHGTGAGTTLGTLAYMSPEQALGEPVGEPTDIFSLGIVLFEMLTGKLPFTGGTPTAVGLQIVQTPAPAPSATIKSLPREIDAIVAKALAKSPGQRYESAAMMASELRSAAAILEARSSSGELLPRTPPLVSPRRSRGSGPLLALAVLIVAAAGAAWSGREAIHRAWRQNIAAPPSPTIAVIPLQLTETDPSHRYFADGLTDDLITRLGQTPGLKVLGRSATRAYRGRSPHDLAQELGATVILTGSVRPSGEAVKVSLELIDPSDSTDLWTGQYTREVKDIFAVQAQVAEEVCRALRIKLQPTPSSTRASLRLIDQRAYDAYLRGRQAVAERRLDEAKSYFEQAIHDDGGLAEAQAGLAEALYLEAFAAAADDPARHERLKRAAERAYELAPDLPQANLAAALASETLADALDYLKKAIGFDPSYSEAYHQIGDQIQDFDPDRAIRFYRKALALDPRMDINHADITSCLSALGRFDEARKEIESARDDAGWKTALRTALDVDQGRYAQALHDMEQGNLIRDTPAFALRYVNTLRMADRRDAAYHEAVSLVQRNPSYCEAKAVLAALRAERGQTASARQLVAPAIRAGAAQDQGPSTLRCAVMSAAALGDATQAAVFLRRLAGDERLLRSWALEAAGTTGSKLLRRGMFPWSRVYDQPAFAQARGVLSETYAAARRRIDLLLKEITP